MDVLLTQSRHRRSTMAPGLTDLPRECLENILRFVESDITYDALESVNGRFSNLVNDGLLWYGKCRERGWADRQKTSLPATSVQWKKIYRERQLLENRWVKLDYDVTTIHSSSAEVCSLKQGDTKFFGGFLDGNVRGWDLTTLSEVNKLRGHAAAVGHLLFEDNLLYTSCFDGSIAMWDTRNGGLVRTLEPTGVAVVGLAKRGSELILATAEGKVVFWNPFYWRSSHSFVAEHVFATSLAIQDDSIALGCIDGSILLCDGSMGKVTGLLPGHEDTVMDMQFDKDSNLLYSCSYDHTVRVWDLNSGTSRILSGHNERVSCLQVLGDRMITGGEDSQLLLWDLKQSRVQHSFHEHSSPVSSICFSDSLVVSGGMDGSVVVRTLVDGPRS